MKNRIQWLLLALFLLWFYSAPWSLFDIFAPPLSESLFPLPDQAHPMQPAAYETSWRIPWQRYQDLQSGLQLAVRQGTYLSANRTASGQLDEIYIRLPIYLPRLNSFAIHILANPQQLSLDKFLESLRTSDDEAYPANGVERLAWWGCRQSIKLRGARRVTIARFGCGNGLAQFRDMECAYQSYIVHKKVVLHIPFCDYSPIKGGRFEPSWEAIRQYQRIVASLR